MKPQREGKAEACKSPKPIITVFSEAAAERERPRLMLTERSARLIAFKDEKKNNLGSQCCCNEFDVCGPGVSSGGKDDWGSYGLIEVEDQAAEQEIRLPIDFRLMAPPQPFCLGADPSGSRSPNPKAADVGSRIGSGRFAGRRQVQGDSGPGEGPAGQILENRCLKRTGWSTLPGGRPLTIWIFVLARKETPLRPSLRLCKWPSRASTSACPTDGPKRNKQRREMVSVNQGRKISAAVGGGGRKKGKEERDAQRGVAWWKPPLGVRWPHGRYRPKLAHHWTSFTEFTIGDARDSNRL